MKNKKTLIIVIVAIVLLIAIGVGVWYFFIREDETGTPSKTGDDKKDEKNGNAGDGKIDKGEALQILGGVITEVGNKL